MTDEEIDAIIWRRSLETCHYVSGYDGRNSTVTLYCVKHNKEFQTR